MTNLSFSYRETVPAIYIRTHNYDGDLRTMLLYHKMKKESLQGINRSCQVSARQLQAIKNCIAIIKETGFSLQKIILFGSCARSQSRYESDIDLLVVVKEIPSTKDILHIKAELNIQIPIDVDLKIVSDEMFSKNDDFFLNKIKRDGVILWQN